MRQPVAGSLPHPTRLQMLDTLSQSVTAREMKRSRAQTFFSVETPVNKGTRPRLSNHQHTQYLMRDLAPALQLHFFSACGPQSVSTSVPPAHIDTLSQATRGSTRTQRERQENGGVCADKLSRIPTSLAEPGLPPKMKHSVHFMHLGHKTGPE